MLVPALVIALLAGGERRWRLDNLRLRLGLVHPLVTEPPGPRPDQSLFRRDRHLSMEAVVAPAADRPRARAEWDEFRQQHPEVQRWRRYQVALDDSERLRERAEEQAAWEAGAPQREAEAAAVRARYEAAKRGGPKLSREESSEHFARWFGDSVVTRDGEPGGKPLRVTHETNHRFDRFTAGEFGFHFGAGIPSGMFGKYRLSGYLSLSAPLRLSDLGVWTPEAVLSQVAGGEREQAVLRQVEEIRAAHDAPTRGMVERARRRGEHALAARWAGLMEENTDASLLRDRLGNYLASRPVHDLLRAEGHDGIVYRNDAEGFADSWIIFEPAQFKLGSNVGTWDPSDPRFRY